MTNSRGWSFIFSFLLFSFFSGRSDYDPLLADHSG